MKSLGKQKEEIARRKRKLEDLLRTTATVNRVEEDEKEAGIKEEQRKGKNNKRKRKK
jgi:hypothetical protein